MVLEISKFGGNFVFIRLRSRLKAVGCLLMERLVREK
jgi:hypothetical protein